MKSFKNILTTVAAATLAAGALLVAQTAPAAHAGHHWQNARMANSLGLTDQQKADAKAIFQEARTASESVRQSLQQERASVQAAIKAGKSAAEIQQLAQSEGPQLAQLAGIHATAQAKFYAMLTPDQQQKMATMQQARHNRMAGRRAPAPAQQ